jgi:hypothetical protein
LALLAAAFGHHRAERRRAPAPQGLTPLTCNEIRHLFTTLITDPVRDAAHRLRCSRWRRRQARARARHYQRQAVEDP